MGHDDLRDQDAARASLGRLINGLGNRDESAPEASRVGRRRRGDEAPAPSDRPAWMSRLAEPRTLTLVMAGFALLGCLGGLLLI